jgi:hypothetical protein
MSAFPPLATSRRTSPEVRFVPIAAIDYSFDHFVGALLELERHVEAERIGCL